MFIGVDPVFLALLFCVASSLMIGPVAEKGDFSPNLSTGILFSFMLGLAFLFMGKDHAKHRNNRNRQGRQQSPSRTPHRTASLLECLTEAIDIVGLAHRARKDPV